MTQSTTGPIFLNNTFILFFFGNNTRFEKITQILQPRLVSRRAVPIGFQHAEQVPVGFPEADELLGLTTNRTAHLLGLEDAEQSYRLRRSRLVPFSYRHAECCMFPALLPFLPPFQF